MLAPAIAAASLARHCGAVTHERTGAARLGRPLGQGRLAQRALLPSAWSTPAQVWSNPTPKYPGADIHTGSSKAQPDPPAGLRNPRRGYAA